MKGEEALPDDDLWAAIADPSRRRVLDLLVQRGEATASSLAGHVPFSRQAVAKHLAVLEEAGLIARRKQGREVLYRVHADRLDQATRAMVEVARQWDRRLAAIKHLAEAAHARAIQHQTTLPKGADHANPTDRPARGMGSGPPPPAHQGEGSDEGP